MAFLFEAPLNERVLKRFVGIENNDFHLWWSYEKKKWVTSDKIGKRGACSSAPCRSFKAFKRHVRKHNLKSALLVSRFVGQNVRYEKSIGDEV